jgi:BirA family biotin operon repressor/biotin-[acetyl-CoA-carboxylase] ligase
LNRLIVIITLAFRILSIKNTNLLPQDTALTSATELLKLDRIDSTNNYAMQLIDAERAVHGLTITAKEQLSGRGQRGKSWSGAPGDCLMMSLILRPAVDLGHQADFLATVAVSVAEAVQEFIPQQPVRIKWPNDIIISDKKAAGILIENVVRGSHWAWAVVGIGLNVGPRKLPQDLPNATSVQAAGYEGSDLDPVAIAIRKRLLERIAMPDDGILDIYNDRLFNIGRRQFFRLDGHFFSATVDGMNLRGQLLLRHHDGQVEAYNHGSLEHIWTRC